MSAKPLEASRAWAPYEPSSACPWNRARAAHLWRRAGFGATWDELEQAVRAGPQKTVDRLLRPAADVAVFNRSCDDFEKAVAASGSPESLRAWWLRRMIRTPHPLGEKMTLFWHDYLGIGAARVANAERVREYVALLRSGAMGKFPALLAGVTRQPMVLLTLGARANHKALPDEHLARQLLHRWTVGPKNCTDRDVREAARAMTGWFVLRDRLRYFQREHDTSVKAVLGKAGAFTDQDVVRIAATQPAAARTVVGRLYRWFFDETQPPDEALIAPLARSFEKDFDVGRLVETMLRSELLFSDRTMGRRIKRPTEFAVGIIRALEGLTPTTPLADALAALGENLLYPPTPDGWEGGRYWINQASLIGRDNLAAALLAPSGPYDGKLDPAAVARRHGQVDAASAGRFLVELLGQPADGDHAGGRPLRGLAGGALSDRMRMLTCRIITQPQFQLA